MNDILDRKQLGELSNPRYNHLRDFSVALAAIEDRFTSARLDAERDSFCRQYCELSRSKGEAAADAYALLVADALQPNSTWSPSNGPLWLHEGK